MRSCVSEGLLKFRSRLLTSNLRTHYARVGEDLRKRYDEVVELSGREYVDAMLKGLARWVDGADNGHLAWGILHFKKKKA